MRGDEKGMSRVFAPEDGVQGGSLSCGTVSGRCEEGVRLGYCLGELAKVFGRDFWYFSRPQITRRALSRDAARNRSYSS